MDPIVRFVIDGNDAEVQSLVNESAACLLNGAVFVFPAETVYGLTGHYFDAAVRERIFFLKQRALSRSFIVLVSGVEGLLECAAQSVPEKILDVLPAPLTLVVWNRFYDLYKEESIAVRVPDRGLIRELLARVKVPLISTSVNISGQPMMNYDEMVRHFSSFVDGIVIDKSFVTGVPSTILDIRSRPFTILRQGEFQVDSKLLDETFCD